MDRWREEVGTGGDRRREVGIGGWRREVGTGGGGKMGTGGWRSWCEMSEVNMAFFV